MKKALKALKESAVTFALSIEQDDLPVYGNCMASGDDAFDKQCSDEIIARLNRGDLWAWCSVKITASFHGYNGVAHLGACSYYNEKAFREDSYNYKDMCSEALKDLNENIARSVADAERLRSLVASA